MLNAYLRLVTALFHTLFFFPDTSCQNSSYQEYFKRQKGKELSEAHLGLCNFSLEMNHYFAHISLSKVNPVSCLYLNSTGLENMILLYGRAQNNWEQVIHTSVRKGTREKLSEQANDLTVCMLLHIMFQTFLLLLGSLFLPTQILFSIYPY